ncbi:MAG: hypothetical protein JNK05_11480 [Myxococcales bacterium]|nr:hypothetical protein [Myxococcales bacterium]
MATLDSPSNPAGMISVGEAVLSAANAIDTKPVKAKLKAFADAHKLFRTLQGAVAAAEDALASHRAKVANADVDQDEAIFALADKLVGDGFERTRPFKGLATRSPSEMASLGYTKEAKEATALAKKVIASKKCGKPSKDAAKALLKAAAAVVKALEPLSKWDAVYRSALTRRDAVAQQWTTTLAALRRASQAAADDGHGHIYTALFRSTAAPAKKKSAKKSAPKA